MFKFKVDHSKAVEFTGNSVLPKGEYEVFAKQERGFKAKTGTIGTEFIFVVRRDVDQKGGGKHIWHSFFHTDRTVDILQSFAKALQMPNGAEYNSREEWAQDVLMRPVRAVVDVEEYEHKGQKKKKNVIKFFKPSELPGIGIDVELHKKDLEEKQPVPVKKASAAPSMQKVAQADPFADDGQPLDISEEDMPF